MIPALASGVSAVVLAAATAASSVAYSDTSQKKCRQINQSVEGEGEYSSFLCKGVGGYTLRVDYDDSRENLTVIGPSGAASDLGLWNTGFSAVGERIEWRLERGRPVALILRHTITEADTGKKVSRLFVAKVSTTKSCLVERIDPGPNQNAKARAAAAKAQKKECLAVDG